MKRTNQEPDNRRGVPRWFVTYTDVITILMTFFILMLTFASSEPEGFELMQESIFGNGGSAGNVGNKVKGSEKETVIVRLKPPHGRIAPRGSEIPPMYTDPATEAASRGLQTLDENNDLVKYKRFSLDVEVSLFVDSNGAPTEIALQQTKLISNQMKRLPLDLTFTVSSPRHVQAIAELAEVMSSQFEVPPGRVGISVGPTMKGLQLSLLQEAL